MTDDHDSHLNWFEKITHALMREPQDRTQLIELLRDAKKRQLLDSDALSMIEGVLSVSEMKVRDVMVPRPQMVVVEQTTHPSDAIPVVVKSAHSRFPVVGENRDQVVGIVLAKDLLKSTVKENEHLTIKELMRPATFIPESKRLDVLLKEFRLNRNHMAIVVDEYGGISGLITIEDVLEEIVGDIVDEYDPTELEPNIKQMNDLEYLVKALTPIEEFNEYFNTDYNNEDFDTIGGLILHHISHFPKPGECFDIDQFKMTILKAETRGIKLVKVIRQVK